MPTTLADIARALGVSKMTVSRAINNHPEISPETRARILEAAHRMNYRPNQFARALTTNRSYLLGVVVPDLMHSYFAEICRGIETVAKPLGYQNLICSTDENVKNEQAEIEALLPRTDGLILASSASPNDAGSHHMARCNSVLAHGPYPAPARNTPSPGSSCSTGPKRQPA